MKPNKIHETRSRDFRNLFSRGNHRGIAPKNDRWKLYRSPAFVAGVAAVMAVPMGIARFPAQAQKNPNPLVSETASESAEVQLARYLTDSGVQMFGAYWCPHCHHQKARFGTEAFEAIDYVECDPKGENSRPQLCQDEEILGYPTWKIEGELYPGDRSLEELA